MPWSVKQRGSKFVVVKQGSGKVVGTHDTRSAAQRQVRALYANEGNSSRKGKSGKRM